MQRSHQGKPVPPDGGPHQRRRRWPGDGDASSVAYIGNVPQSSNAAFLEATGDHTMGQRATTHAGRADRKRYGGECWRAVSRRVDSVGTDNQRHVIVPSHRAGDRHVTQSTGAAVVVTSRLRRRLLSRHRSAAMSSLRRSPQ